MALRNLVTRMRTPAAAALRLPSGPRVSPAAGSRALAANSSSPQEQEKKFRTTAERLETSTKFVRSAFKVFVPSAIVVMFVKAVK